MVSGQVVSWYQRCGFASLDDLESPQCQEALRELEEVQSDFLSQEKRFRSPAYRWPRDPLHFVARPWEYAYVLSHLRDWQANHPEGDRLQVMDFGSGVTFFPFALARRNMAVTAVDVDPLVQNDLRQASRVVSALPGTVSFTLSREDNAIPVETSSFDCVYSVSVLEHVPDRLWAARELRRVLKPHGWLILTFDVCFQGGAEIAPGPFVPLTNYLRDQFELVWPEVSVHPARTLSCYNGPYPLGGRASLSRRLRRWSKNGVKRVIGKSVVPLDCVFMGMVLRKT